MQWTEDIAKDYWKLVAMPNETEGIDGITVGSCWTNGMDTAKELGLTDNEFWNAANYHAVMAARLAEIL